ncbi:uncharacterized protein LOC111642609 isoform X1 [Centruroides sculpturatus]|uniref:uncharacterized protein LOC111642609 isoform X1 n=1 Tax=Centruroides sculpturatus TaxID=218467 RepID=UPI000C6E106E|nr:uncharacterized protein LOC111642609 isoform X1 [Centruroides sculpturatus]
MTREMTFYQLCLCYIKENTEEILMFYQEKNVNLTDLFCRLPPVICEDLITPPNHLPLLMHCIFRIGIKKLDLLFYRRKLPVEDIQEVCKRITIARLTFTNLSENDLQVLARHFLNIVQLNLSHTDTSDNVLKTIGESCKYLKILDVSSCPITDNGLLFLCYDLKNKVRCSQLERIKVFVTSVTWKGLLNILINHNLRSFDAITSNYFHTLNQYCKYYSDRNLYLENLDVFPIRDEPLNVYELLLCTPYLKKLCLFNVDISDEEFLSLPRFSHLEQLSVFVPDSCLTFEVGMVNFLSVSGRNLKRLELKHFNYVNVYFIGMYCTSLEVLSLFSTRHLHFRSRCYNNFANYKTLKQLTIDISDGRPWDDFFQSTFPNCPSLQKLCIKRIDVTEDLCKAIRFLPKTLSGITLASCRNITKALIYQFIDNLPNLRIFSLHQRKYWIPPGDLDEIHNYLNAINSSLWFDYSGHFPFE